MGRAGRNAAGGSHADPSAAGMKTPSVTHACRCTWRLRAEPKRCRKETAPSRGREPLGVSASRMRPEGHEQRSLDLVNKDLRQGRDGLRSIGEISTQSPGHRNHPLPDRHQRDDVVGEVSGRLHRPAAIAARTYASALAGLRAGDGGPTHRADGRAADPRPLSRGRHGLLTRGTWGATSATVRSAQALASIASRRL